MVIDAYRSILMIHPTGPNDKHHLEIIERARRIGITDVELGLEKPPRPTATEEENWLASIVSDGPAVEWNYNRFIDRRPDQAPRFWRST